MKIGFCLKIVPKSHFDWDVWLYVKENYVLKSMVCTPFAFTMDIPTGTKNNSCQKVLWSNV